MKKLLLIISALTLSTTLFAQEDGQKGEVRLNNGSIIKGTITSQNRDSVTIESGGEEYTYGSREYRKVLIYSKTHNRKGFIGISAGPSIPLGDFGSELNGGAKVGLNLAVVNFGYRFNDYIGITGTWFGAANPLEILGDDSFDPWSYGGITVGPMFTIPLVRNKVELDLRPMAGYSIATVPDLGDGTESAAAFAFIGSAMLRFHCSSRISVLVHGDYLYTKPTFDYYNFEQNISTLSINGGIAYRFK